MKKISVILPVFNGEKTIVETMMSVLRQTVTDFELIVIDDGSTDQTCERVESIRDARIHLSRFPNRGLAASRNRGLRLSEGEFFSFIDADDLWVPNKLEMQVASLESKPEFGVAYSWTSTIDESGDFIRAIAPVSHEGNVYCQMLERCFVASGSNIMCRKDLIEKVGYYNEEFRLGSDWEFNIRLAGKCSFVLVPEYQIFYRQSPQSITSNVRNVEQYLLRVIEEAFRQAPEEVQHLKRRSLSYNYQHIADKYLENSQPLQRRIQGVIKLAKSLYFYPPRVVTKSYMGVFAKCMLTLMMPAAHANKIMRILYRIDARIDRHPSAVAREPLSKTT